MLSDVRSYYGFARDFAQAGYFETAHSQQIVRELSYEIRAGASGHRARHHQDSGDGAGEHNRCPAMRHELIPQ